MRIAGIDGRTARQARVLALLVSLSLFASAGLLTGCGGSFDGGLGGEFKEQQKTGSGLTTGSTPETASAAVPLPRSAEALTSVATPGNAAYKIGPQDVLDVSVFKVPDLTRSVQVADTGTINVPLLGEVPAAGKTARELERDLAKRLGAKYLQSPQVSVAIKEYNSQRVTIEGAVKTPGVHALKGKTTLIQLVALSGGLDAATSDSTVVSVRYTDGKRYAAKCDVAAIKSGEAQDPAILPGDVVVANSSALKAAWADFLKALPVATFAALVL